MPNRKKKTDGRQFTSLSTNEGTYELWNSLTADEEQLVINQLGLEKGNLPLSKKDAQRQRLLFGQGNFGKVRLANKDGKLFAVKKIEVTSTSDMDNLLKEYNFGKLLKAANIPHVAYGSDGTLSINARGQETFYLFMDKIASLGDGDDLKKLLRYMDSQEQKTAILSHTASSLLEAVAKMHDHQIYHRDIKANNILLSSTGEVYLSDFGSAMTENRDLISDVLDQDSDGYAVSNQSDRRYYSPEIHICVQTKQPSSSEITAALDNWRLGLTLLQLCGAIKENEGILARPAQWMNELREKTNEADIAEAIKSRFEYEIEKIKTESMHKIPVELRDIAFGLLAVDYEKRLTAADALSMLQQSSPADAPLVEEGFKNLVHSQIAETVKKSIRKALKKEADNSIDGQEWIDKALNDFKQLLNNPHATAEHIQNFVSYWILDESNRPNFSSDQYEAALDRIRAKPSRVQSQESHSNRQTKTDDQQFTSISTNEGTYELWNSLTDSQEQLVINQLGLEKGNLPLSKKDEQRQRLLFGQGNFGKVRLANKDGKLFAVKKIEVTAKTDMDTLLKEYNFGKLLKAANIPHVAYGADGTLSKNARGQETFYLFMDNIASLGDGGDLKTLLSYVDSQEQKTAILSHTAGSLLEAVAKMHEHQMYHRDIKANNILLSSTGEVYLSDFGSAMTENSALISDVLNEDSNIYAVSNQSDMRYYSPEIHICVQTQQPSSREITAATDNWRMGLTLLQLCGAIKEGEGILASPRIWMPELKQKANGADLGEAIKSRFENEIEKIKTESMDKIPVELREVVFGLLAVDHEKRLRAADALSMLQQSSPADAPLVEEGFKNLVHSQIAETVKKSIKKALIKEAENRGDDMDLEKALKIFKHLVNAPYATPEHLQHFVSYWIQDESNLPNFSLEHYEAALDRIKSKKSPAQSQNQEVYINHTVEEEIRLPPPLLDNYSPLPLVKPENTGSHYTAIPRPMKDKDSHYTALSPSAAHVPDDPKWNRLEESCLRSADDLLSYANSKVENNSEASKEVEGVFQNFKAGIHRIKNLIHPKQKDMTADKPTVKKPVDENAIKAVFARTEQYLRQLTVGKLMGLTSKETSAVVRKLENDKQFLARIADKTNTNISSEIFLQIDEKLLLLNELSLDRQVYISNKPLSAAQILEHEPEAKVFRAQNKETQSEYTFTASEDISAYPLPLSDTIQNFIAKQTIQKPNQSEEVYIYTTKASLGKKLAISISQLGGNDSNLKIYVNDKLLTSKVEHTNKSMFNFFKKHNKDKKTEQNAEFTLEEVSSTKLSSGK